MEVKEEITTFGYSFENVTWFYKRKFITTRYFSLETDSTFLIWK